MTSGRLSLQSPGIIEQAYQDKESLNGHTMASIKAQQLILTTPEFHATGHVTPNPTNLHPEHSLPAPTTKPYKAVVFLMLTSGCNSYNMIVWHRCSNRNELVNQYNKVHGDLKLQSSEWARIIDIPGQLTEEFTLHPEIHMVEKNTRMVTSHFISTQDC